MSETSFPSLEESSHLWAEIRCWVKSTQFTDELRAVDKKSSRSSSGIVRDMKELSSHSMHKKVDICSGGMTGIYKTCFGGRCASEPQVDGRSLKTVPADVMMSEAALTYYLTHCIGDTATKFLVVSPEMTNQLIIQADKLDVSCVIRRYNRIEMRLCASATVFDVDQIHYLRCSGCHFSVLSVLRLTNEAHHIYVNCSTGGERRWTDVNMASLLHGLALFYESKHGEGSFDIKKWRAPSGKGSGHSAIQNGGTVCGAYVPYNIESMARHGKIFPKISTDVIRTYRRYMAVKIVDMTKKSSKFTLMPDDGFPKKQNKSTLTPENEWHKKKIRYMTQGKNGEKNEVIDLT